MKRLQREYYFSDTYGSSGSSPFDRPDADAIITTDFRSRTPEYRHAKFDIYHTAAETAHFLRMVLSLDEEMMSTLKGAQKDRYASTTTGMFINVAPRTEAHSNGQPFYVATAAEGRIRIVSTPLDALSPVKSRIETLQHLPNKDNQLYGNAEQFRSSFTPVLLQEDHGFELRDTSIDEVPDPRRDWHVSFVDRFGNVITHAESDVLHDVQSRLLSMQNDVRVCLGGTEFGPFQTAESLGDAEPGLVSVYTNGGIDFARKWQSGETPIERLERSAYMTLAKPDVGSTISFTDGL